MSCSTLENLKAAVTLPTVAALLYFVVLAEQPAARWVYAGSKLVQFGWETITEALKQGGLTLMLDRLSNPAKIKAFELAEELRGLMRRISGRKAVAAGIAGLALALGTEPSGATSIAAVDSALASTPTLCRRTLSAAARRQPTPT